MITVDQITSADWSLELDTTTGGTMGDGSGIGNVVQGLDDVAQCIAIILSTPKGSDILRPTFGADLWKYIDRPINQSIPALVRDVFEALTHWEPRVTNITVTAAPIIDGSSQTGAKLNLSITWTLKLGGSKTQTTNVVIGRPALNG